MEERVFVTNTCNATISMDGCYPREEKEMHASDHYNAAKAALRNFDFKESKQEYQFMLDEIVRQYIYDTVSESFCSLIGEQIIFDTLAVDQTPFDLDFDEIENAIDNVLKRWNGKIRPSVEGLFDLVLDTESGETYYSVFP